MNPLHLEKKYYLCLIKQFDKVTLSVLLEANGTFISYFSSSRVRPFFFVRHVIHLHMNRLTGQGLKFHSL